jgi:hypothetical protein
MKAVLKFDCEDMEERRLLACAIRSNELAIACWELRSNVFRLFDTFIDFHGEGLTETQMEKLEELKTSIYETIPENLDELVS